MMNRPAPTIAPGSLTFDVRLLPETVWKSTFEEFIGAALIGPHYGFDARGSGSDEWEPYFEADPVELVWSGEEYEVWAVEPDFQPAHTVLLRHAGTTIGFYGSGMLWIDEGHRGKGLAPMLVLSGWKVAGKDGPYDRKSLFGFSPSGEAAHLAAHRFAVAAAVEAGMPVPDDVLDEYGYEAPSPR